MVSVSKTALWLFCLSMRFQSQLIAAQNCLFNTNPTRCFEIHFTGSQVDWNPAQQGCEHFHGQSAMLASIQNAFENNFILSFAPTNSIDTWIGGYSDQGGSRRWLDGTPFSFNNFAPGQGSSLNSCFKLCLAEQIDCPRGKWKAVSCTSPTISFLCNPLSSGELPATDSSSPSSPLTSPSNLRSTTTSSTDSTAPQWTSAYPVTVSPSLPSSYTDCYDWLHIGNATVNGIYKIQPNGQQQPIQVVCDMTTEGGGWTVFQRRVDNSTVFWTRLWNDYKMGFGSLEESLWLGLDNVHSLTANDTNVTLRIEVRGNRCLWSHTNCGPNLIYIDEWSSFQIDSEADKYRLHISMSPNGPGNLSAIMYFLSDSNLQPFTTADENNAHWGNENCASRPRGQFGPWWYSFCGRNHLNGKYDPDRTGPDPGPGEVPGGFAWDNGIEWINPMMSEMKLRRNG